MEILEVELMESLLSSFAVFMSQVEMWKYLGQGRAENYLEMSQSISYKTFHKFLPRDFLFLLIWSRSITLAKVTASK